MAKKRLTGHTKEIHKQAVAIRKRVAAMPDGDLVELSQQMETMNFGKVAKERASVERFDAAATMTINPPDTPEARAELEQVLSGSRVAAIGVAECSIEEFLNGLEAANLRGIGKITIKKIGDFAKEKGYI